jgi:hypothetical protein
MESQKDHPLTTPRILAALAIAGVFWTAGVTMIDQRAGVAIPLCSIGIAATLWIFWPLLKAIRFTERKSWPWLGLVLLFLEVAVPIYMLSVKAPMPSNSTSKRPIQGDRPTIESEFARARVPTLGNPTGIIEVTNGMYQASHERAMVISLLPVQTVYVLPKESNRPAIAFHYAMIDDDKKWWDDKFLREKFKVPQNKKPPEYRVAELWDQKPDQWKWIGWREWSCPFTLEKFYYQKFESGIIFGVLPTSESLGSSQIIVVVDDGKWSAIEPVDQLGAIEAPACNENTATVNGVVIHGRRVKPRVPTDD